jgi:hypothetical protein
MNKHLLAVCALIAIGGAAHAQTANDLRQPSVTARGSEACAQWNVKGKELAECRRAWMDANTDADRLKVRERYERRPEAQKAHPTTKTLAPGQVDATTSCDHWNLKPADLSECRAQLKAARNQSDFARIENRYAPGRRRPEDSRVKTSGSKSPD